MKALTYEGIGNIRLRNHPKPIPQKGEQLIHVAAVGVCGSDIDIVRGGYPLLQAPIVLGHEFCGFNEDREFVVVNPIMGCGTCSMCETGNTNRCASRSTIGINRQGGYAEYVSVPQRNIIPAPRLTAEQGVLVEPTATGLHAWNQVGRPKGQVAIIGAGSVGQCLLQAMRANGVAQIDVIDTNTERLVRARELGATQALHAFCDDGYEAVFDTVGSRQTLSDALDHVKRGGNVALIGLSSKDVQLSAAQFVACDRTVFGCFAYSENEFREAARLVEGFDTTGLVHVAINEAESAWAQLLADAGRVSDFKVALFFTEFVPTHRGDTKIGPH